MSDLDANGNVINNEPRHSARMKSNATDIRRVIPPTGVKTFLFGEPVESVFKTIQEYTGEATCDEGVEIIIHGTTNDAFEPKYRGGSFFLKLGGTTGDLDLESLSDVFQITRKPNNTTFTDPLEESSESIFVPTENLSEVSIAVGITNAFQVLNSTKTQLELRIK